MDNASRVAPKRVIIADDVPGVRRDLSTLLNLLGNIDIVGEAANGAEAVTLTRISKPDVILMDLEMPVMDGFEATLKIKSMYPDCRVVMLTIHGGIEERKKATESGADSFLVKGVTIDALKASIYGISTAEFNKE